MYLNDTVDTRNDTQLIHIFLIKVNYVNTTTTKLAAEPI